MEKLRFKKFDHLAYNNENTNKLSSNGLFRIQPLDDRIFSKINHHPSRNTSYILPTLSQLPSLPLWCIHTISTRVYVFPQRYIFFRPVTYRIIFLFFSGLCLANASRSTPLIPYPTTHFCPYVYTLARFPSCTHSNNSSTDHPAGLLIRARFALIYYDAPSQAHCRGGLHAPLPSKISEFLRSLAPIKLIPPSNVM